LYYYGVFINYKITTMLWENASLSFITKIKSEI
jgi:hypothetical protein